MSAAGAEEAEEQRKSRPFGPQEMSPFLSTPSRTWLLTAGPSDLKDSGDEIEPAPRLGVLSKALGDKLELKDEQYPGRLIF